MPVFGPHPIQNSAPVMLVFNLDHTPESLITQHKHHRADKWFMYLDLDGTTACTCYSIKCCGGRKMEGLFLISAPVFKKMMLICHYFVTCCVSKKWTPPTDRGWCRGTFPMFTVPRDKYCTCYDDFSAGGRKLERAENWLNCPSTCTMYSTFYKLLKSKYKRNFITL